MLSFLLGLYIPGYGMKEPKIKTKDAGKDTSLPVSRY